ncbi:bacteriophage holin [Candidatus Woesearchaeota archaeon]|nr:bacteriophage holin [Candidatus Woesearchaeota archaeon]
MFSCLHFGGHGMEKLNVRAFAVSLGLVCGIGVFILGIVSMFGWGIILIRPISSIYVGFAPTVVGSLIGAVWAFVDGAIGGLIFATLYNYVAEKV